MFLQLWSDALPGGTIIQIRRVNQIRLTAKTKTVQNADGKFDPPITITTARPVGGDYTFINGEDINNNVHNKWAKDKLGIEIKDLWDTADNAAYHTKLRLSLTTQDQLPDVFIVQDVNLIATSFNPAR